MRKLALILPLFIACQTTAPRGGEPTSTPPARTTPDAPVVAETRLAVAPDTPARMAQLPRTVIDYDRSLLGENERRVVEKLIDASKVIDELYWQQVAEENPAVRARLASQADESPLDRAAYDYFIANKGRWDRLANNEPFIEPFGAAGAKPPGAAFYPADITKEEFEHYVAANPAQQGELQGLFTVVRREGDRLVSIPYSRYYGDLLNVAARRVREAATLTTNASLRDYLEKLAVALLDDDYRRSDMAWMDLTGPLEVIIGPYEVYEDELFNFKASFESFITVVDRGESEKLTVYGQHLPAMENNLPIPDQYKNPGRGTESPIRVVQEIYTAGDARRGVQTAAFNLPNDEYVRERKGSKKVLLKNVMDAKYRQSGQPIALRVLDPSLAGHLSFEAFFNHVLFHELSHGLGPGLITRPTGERVDVRLLLKNLYSTVEETKADVLGIWNILYAQDRKLLTSFGERELFATYAGLMFRSMRFGVDQAHGRGNAVQWNWLRERGAITPAGAGRYTIDIPRMKEGIRDLAAELLTIQATGDFDRAQRLLERYGVATPEITGVISRLSDIPVDITPVFPAAGEW
ncbi:MAG TPA: peptidase [Thermoanaerobaculia bacterium]|nr:peptidase [Thermoanaerobaculia bacterium]